MKDFLLDNLYKNDSNYPSEGSFTDKFLYYRGTDDGIDVDVSKYMIENYIKTNPYFNGKEIKIKKQYNEKYKYEIIVGEEIYRGDTFVNCMQTILQLINYGKEQRIVSREIHKIREEISKLDDNTKRILEKFTYNCYREGNFFAIPYKPYKSLNSAKGQLREIGFAGLENKKYYLYDSYYTYIIELKDYFDNGNTETHIAKLIDENYTGWKKRYRGLGNRVFIEDNKLDGFYKDGVPIKFLNIEKEFNVAMEEYLVNITKALENRTNLVKGGYNEI